MWQSGSKLGNSGSIKILLCHYVNSVSTVSNKSSIFSGLSHNASAPSCFQSFPRSAYAVTMAITGDNCCCQAKTMIRTWAWFGGGKPTKRRVLKSEPKEQVVVVYDTPLWQGKGIGDGDSQNKPGGAQIHIQELRRISPQAGGAWQTKTRWRPCARSSVMASLGL